MDEERYPVDIKIKKKSIKGFGLLETIIIIVITAIISGITTGVILYNSFNDKTGNSYSSLTGDENLKEFLDVYNSVSNEYYQKIDKKEMLEEAIEAMMDYLGDDYTSYLSEDETTVLSETLSGKYKGIGVSFRDKTILSVFKNSPAEIAGIMANDIIVRINDKDCAKMNDNEIVELIKEDSENINLVVNREGKELNFNLKLDSLNIPAITYDILDNGTGYIYISTFSNTLSEQVNSALIELEAKNIKSLIIDVRDNSGGYLVSALDVASLFLEKGKVVYSLQANNLLQAYYDETDDKRSYEIVVLINKNSASAAEVLAASLKESYGATLVGNTSYGKGKVQQTKMLSNGKMVKYTTARWLTPTNDCIDGIGIIPDYEIDLEYHYNESGEVISFDDTQLKKGVEILSKN